MTKPRQMSPAQAEAARHILESDDGLIRPYPGGKWSTLRGGQREGWSTQMGTVRAMQTHGWLERSRLRAEAWLDPRRLTAAGKAELARIDSMPARAASAST